MSRNCVQTYPSTPTVQTSVLSPFTFSVPMRSTTRPVATSHFRRLLSEHPVTSHESSHSSSSSSLVSSFCKFSLDREGRGGPQATLRILPFTRSNFRLLVRVSESSEINLTVPSSQPRATRVDAGLTAMHQIEPPCEPIVCCSQLTTRIAMNN